MNFTGLHFVYEGQEVWLSTIYRHEDGCSGEFQGTCDGTTVRLTCPSCGAFHEIMLNSDIEREEPNELF